MSASSRLAQGWIHGAGSVVPARPAVPTPARGESGIVTSLLRWAERALQRWSADGRPQNADELLVYARSIERDMPGLAADLRAAALRHKNAKG